MIQITNRRMIMFIALVIVGVLALIQGSNYYNHSIYTNNHRKLLFTDKDDVCRRTATTTIPWWMRWLDYFHPTCICTQSSIRDMIQQYQQQLSSLSRTSTTITLCQDSYIEFAMPLNISNTNLHLRCSPGRTSFSLPCRFNGSNQTNFFIGNNANVTLQNIHFINGNANHLVTTMDGGALNLIDSTLTIDQCIFENNVANNGAGGAIFMVRTDDSGGSSIAGTSTDSSLRIIDTTFHQNHANDGGAIALKHMVVGSPSIHIESTKFIGNTANSAAGAIIFHRCRNVEILHTNFHFNHASSMYGGALALYRTQIHFIGTTFFDNTINFYSSSYNNVYIYDNDRPGYGGSFVDCDEHTLFCSRGNTSNSSYHNNKNDTSSLIGIIEKSNTTIDIDNNSNNVTYRNHNCNLDGTIVENIQSADQCVL